MSAISCPSLPLFLEKHHHDGNESVVSFTVEEKGPTHAVMEYKWIFEQHIYHSTCLRSYVHNYHVVDYIGHACGLPRNLKITSGGLA